MDDQEIKEVVFNTLDFGGGALTAVREHCEDYDVEFTDEIERKAMDAIEEYYKSIP